MRHPDGSSPVQPLPPEPGLQPPLRTVRRGPLVAVVAAVLLLIVVGSIGLGTPPTDEAVSTAPGAIASGDPEVTTTTTTTTTLPPTLAEMAPVASPIIIIPSQSDTLLWVWHPSAREPQWVPLPRAPRDVGFDASGVWMSYLVPDGDGTALWMGIPTGGQAAQRMGVTSFRWHPATVETIAWTATEGADPATNRIHVGTVEARTGAITDGPGSVAIDPGHCLLAWGDWGFATGPCEGGFGLVTYDPDGAAVAASPLHLVAASASGRLVVRDAQDQVRVVDAALDTVALLEIEPGAELSVTADGEEVVETLTRNGRTRVRSFPVERRGGSSVSVEGESRLLGLSASQEYALLHAWGTGELVLVNWSSGATFRIPGNWPYLEATWVP